MLKSMIFFKFVIQVFSELFSQISTKFFNSLKTGHGRKRRAIEHEDKNVTEYTKFKENLQYTVLMPGELTNEVKYRESGDQCRNFVMISGLLAGLLALSTIIVSSLGIRKEDNIHTIRQDHKKIFFIFLQDLGNKQIFKIDFFMNSPSFFAGFRALEIFIELVLA